MRRNLLTFLGLFALACGLLFTLQGLGVIRWPASSMMIDSRTWILRGAIVAGLGILLIAVSRFTPGRSGSPDRRRR